MGSASEIASATDGAEVELVVVGQAQGIGLVVGRRPDGRVARSIDGQVLLLESDLDRRRQRAAGSARTRRRGAVVRSAVGDDAAVLVGEPDAARDRARRGSRSSGRSTVASAMSIVRVAPTPSPSSPATLMRNGVVGHGRARRRGVLRLVLPVVLVERRRPRRRRPAVGAGDQRGAAVVEQGDALLDALEGLGDVALEALEDADRVLVGAAPDAVGVVVGLVDDPLALDRRRPGSARARR